MNDPYQVLGVSRSATEKEIKAAYKELVKKYHPDQYQGNPLAEFAEEKMAEVNAAYDQIINERRNGGSSAYYGSGSSGYYDAGASSGPQAACDFDNREIRRLIASGNITQAEQLLDVVPESSRNAEWYFLKGNVAYSRGWLNDAYSCFDQACKLDPNNSEYSAVLNRMNSQRGGYMAGNNMRSQQSGMDSTLDCLSTLCIVDCCCECMGGDFIRCC
ncbi:MAG: DnaJ domain-containing protein [Ruminococcus sp.]|nr:DnaJ domain-containing protein [Ruminococcus sp.]